MTHCPTCHGSLDHLNAFELIDGTDNDCHDTGTEEEMQREAIVRNAGEDPDRFPVYRPRWKVRPAGFSDENYRGAS